MKTALVTLLAGLSLGLGSATAQDVEELRVALPASHDLVLIQPGVQVIPDFDLEVFFTGGSYWLHTDGAWYRCHRPSQSSPFQLVPNKAVPGALASLPLGRYLQYQPKPGEQRSVKTLAATDLPESGAEVEAGPVKVEPAVAKPAPAAAKAAPAKVAPAKPAAPAAKKKKP